MRIVNVRRISQGFFFLLFFWFCTVMNLGDRWWELRGWPVNWLLELDPLVGLGTLLATRTLYSGLLWGLATVVLTIFLGRFFCGWLCPFGTLHQMVGYLGHRKRTRADKAILNRYRPGHSIKYWILTLLLSGAAVDVAGDLLALPRETPRIFWLIIAGCLVAAAAMAGRRALPNPGKSLGLLLVCMAAWALLGRMFHAGSLPSASLQTGLLDPLPLFHRSVNLVLLPLMDGEGGFLSAHPRFYGEAGVIGAVFLGAVLLNLHTPRFYCRFVCPLGALFGVMSRNVLWRIGKQHAECRECHLCRAHCEGACEPSARIRIAECLLCMNCLDECRHGVLGFTASPPVDGEIPSPDFSRRGFVLSLAAGLVSIPMFRIDGSMGTNWNPMLVRPPGSLAETDFLKRCIKCGQCMRVCPTNVLQPAGIDFGLEALWTPVLNFRIGTSGCQLNCIACGHLCPTAAIRPLSLAEKLGTGNGPVRMGTAFVDRGRCLPWAMDIPCIVCQENCPVSPKAITTRDQFAVVQPTTLTVAGVSGTDGSHIDLVRGDLEPDRYGTGDYWIRAREGGEDRPRRILTNTRQRITLSGGHRMQMQGEPGPPAGSRLDLLIRLQQPVVDPNRCIGCGICQHECPVKGKRAIRVTAENESRDRSHAMVLGG